MRAFSFCTFVPPKRFGQFSVALFDAKRKPAFRRASIEFKQPYCWVGVYVLGFVHAA